MTKKMIIIASVAAMLTIWSFLAFEKGIEIINYLDIIIFISIILLGIVLIFREQKKEKEKKLGIPIEDELSTKIKYKAGYYAFIYSMYMWLFIFIIKDKFPNIESIVGGGVLLSALIFTLTKIAITKEFNDKTE